MVPPSPHLEMASMIAGESSLAPDLGVHEESLA